MSLTELGSNFTKRDIEELHDRLIVEGIDDPLLGGRRSGQLHVGVLASPHGQFLPDLCIRIEDGRIGGEGNQCLFDFVQHVSKVLVAQVPELFHATDLACKAS